MIKPDQSQSTNTFEEKSLLDDVIEVPIPKRKVQQVYCAYCGACPPKEGCFYDKYIMNREVEID